MLCVWLRRRKEEKTGEEVSRRDWKGMRGKVSFLGQAPHLAFEHHSYLPIVKVRDLSSKTVFHIAVTEYLTESAWGEDFL